MATTTTRLGLRKPAGTDAVNVTTDISDNADKLDAAAGFERLSSFPGSPFSGKAIHRSDQNDQPYLYNSTAWVPIAHHRTFVRKTSDESVTSSTTLQDDNDLLLAVVAGGIYRLFLCYGFTCSAAGDIKHAWTVPGGATNCLRTTFGPSASTAGNDPVTFRVFSSTSETGAGGFGGVAGATYPVKEDMIFTATSAGNVVFQWAQLVSDATASVVKAGSFIEMWRIG